MKEMLLGTLKQLPLLLLLQQQLLQRLLLVAQGQVEPSQFLMMGTGA
jgi:hypothetical protein